MTTTPDNNGQPPNRLDLIEGFLLQTVTGLSQVTQRLDRMAEQQENTDSNLNDLSNRVNDFIGTANTVLGRSVILDDIVLGIDARTTALESIVVRLDRNFEELSRNLGENQRSTNAALERLEAILLKLIDRNGGNNTPV